MAVRQRNEEMMREKREERIRVGRSCGGRHTLQCDPGQDNAGDAAIQRGRALTAKGRTSPTKRSTPNLRPTTANK